MSEGTGLELMLTFIMSYCTSLQILIGRPILCQNSLSLLIFPTHCVCFCFLKLLPDYSLSVPDSGCVCIRAQGHQITNCSTVR